MKKQQQIYADAFLKEKKDTILIELSGGKLQPGSNLNRTVLSKEAEPMYHVLLDWVHKLKDDRLSEERTQVTLEELYSKNYYYQDVIEFWLTRSFEHDSSFSYAYKYLARKINRAHVELLFTPKPSTPEEIECAVLESKAGSGTLSKDLETDVAKRLLSKAESAGLIKVEGHRYTWTKEKQLAAYFAMRASRWLNLRKGKLDVNDNQTISWAPFEKLFGLSNLKLCKHDWLKINPDFFPTGHKEVDILFDKISL